jgi:aspartate racemase
MKKLGLLGGMSWESSIEYERLIHQQVRSTLGGTHSADLIIRSVDFALIEELQARGAWEEAGDLLAGEAQTLEKAGAEAIVLCTNTMHKVAPIIEAAIDIPLLHIVDATAAAMKTAGVTSVALLATAYTMEDPFYVDRLADLGFTAIVPGANNRAEIQRIIYSELVKGVLSDTSRAFMVSVIDDLVASGVEAVIAGCTEIELLVTAKDVSVPYFPTTALHAHFATQWALGDLS